MNLLAEDARNLASALAQNCPQTDGDIEILIAPACPYLTSVAECISGSSILLGAQNVSSEPPGAFTGEVAVEMLKDVGCQYVILGHSERRHLLGETDAEISKKIQAALAGGLSVIFCVGELLEDREAGKTEEVLNGQLSGGLEGVDAASMQNIVIAYEPVWAIGTGVTATPEQAESAHAYLRNRLANRYNSEVAEQTRIQYGGSVKPTNAHELLSQPNVDGALVGGASLQVESFLGIIEAARSLHRG